uniref:Uncharacterized protein n=1 Tax=viral metagenome TaxID=1070528 RepID=A0A6C0LN89_9ZZZZ
MTDDNFIAYENSFILPKTSYNFSWCPDIELDSNTEKIEMTGFDNTTGNKKCYELLQNYNTRDTWKDKGVNFPDYSLRVSGNKGSHTCHIISDKKTGCIAEGNWPYEHKSPELTLPGARYAFPDYPQYNNNNFTFRIPNITEDQCKEILKTGKRPVFRIKNSGNKYLTYKGIGNKGLKMLVSSPTDDINNQAFWWWFEYFKTENGVNYYRIWNYQMDMVVAVDVKGAGFYGCDDCKQMTLKPSFMTGNDVLWRFDQTTKEWNKNTADSYLIRTHERSDQGDDYAFTIVDNDENVSIQAITNPKLCGDKNSGCNIILEPVMSGIVTNNTSANDVIDISSGIYDYWEKDGYKECLLYPGVPGSTIMPKELLTAKAMVDVPEYITTKALVIDEVNKRLDMDKTIINHYSDKDSAKNDLDYLALNRRFNENNMGKTLTFNDVKDDNECYSIIRNEQKSDIWTDKDKSNIPILAEYDSVGKTCKVFNLPETDDNSVAYIFGYKVNGGTLNSDIQVTNNTDIQSCVMNSNNFKFPLVSNVGETKCTYYGYKPINENDSNISTIIDMKKVFETYKDCALKNNNKNRNDCNHWGSENFNDDKSVDNVMGSWCKAQATKDGKDINNIESWPVECRCIAAEYIENTNGTFKVDEAWAGLSKASKAVYGEDHKMCVVDECHVNSEKDGINYYHPTSVTIPDTKDGKPPCAASVCSINIKNIGNGTFKDIGCNKDDDTNGEKFKCIQNYNGCQQNYNSDGWDSMEECEKHCGNKPKSNIKMIMIIVMIVIIILSSIAIVVITFKLKNKAISTNIR